MSSPFPGIDPYIEARGLWGDFHSNLIAEMQNAIASQLPDRYVVRADERSYVALAESDDESRRPFIPDVSVTTGPPSTRSPRRLKSSGVGANQASESGAVIMKALIQAEYRETFLEISQVEPERKLVTGIEVLSPSNKRPGTKEWRLYLRKRRAYLSGYANFVELDFLRLGQRMPMASPWPDSPYYMLVCRKSKAPRCAVWPAYFTEPLPPIPIPLLPPDADLSLNIQPMLGAIYARSRYERDIDYKAVLAPPLRDEDRSWLESRMWKKKGVK